MDWNSSGQLRVVVVRPVHSVDRPCPGGCCGVSPSTGGCGRSRSFCGAGLSAVHERPDCTGRDAFPGRYAHRVQACGARFPQTGACGSPAHPDRPSTRHPASRTGSPQAFPDAAHSYWDGPVRTDGLRNRPGTKQDRPGGGHWRWAWSERPVSAWGRVAPMTRRNVTRGGRRWPRGSGEGQRHARTVPGPACTLRGTPHSVRFDLPVAAASLRCGGLSRVRRT